MREDDLAHFAPADGLLARIRQRPSGMTEAEREYLLHQASAQLARTVDLEPAEARRLVEPMTADNQTTIQCGQQFACVSAFGRLLVVFARVELRGRCHPDLN
jgi:hypothetical protein